MHRRIFCISIFALLVALVSGGRIDRLTASENWPHWRGPALNGSTTETNLPERWSKTENVAWSTPLPGHSGATPVIWNDSVFLPSPDADGNLLLFCFDAKSGKIRWQNTVGHGNFVNGKNNMASPSASTDGKRVVIIFGTGDLAAFDFEGKLLWSRSLSKQYGKFALMWLYGSSPLFYGEKLYIQLLQRNDPSVYKHAVDDKPTRESFLLCLDPQSGNEVWRQERKTDAVAESHDAYSSPIVRQTANGAEIVIFGADYVTGNNPDTGAELWRTGSLNAKKSPVWRTIVSPVVGPEGIFVCLPRAKSPMVAVSPGKPGDTSESPVLWRSMDASSDVPTPLYYQGKVFVLDGNRKVLTCVDPKTGKTVWNGRMGSDEVFSASPTGADGKIYCIGEEGTVVILSAGDQFKILSRFNMEGEGARSHGSPILSTIAVSNGHLFIRLPDSLVCIGAK